MCMQTPWEKTLEFHGRVCPELVVGFRAAEVGMRELGAGAPGSVDMVAIVENKGPGADAVQVVTGCTIGKGSLYMPDYAKQVFTFARRDTGQAVRVACRPETFSGGELKSFTEAVCDEPSPENQRALDRKREEMADQLLEMPEEQLFDIRPVDAELPARPVVQDYIRCSRCGEGAAASHTQSVAGQTVCLSCLDSVQRDVS